VAENIALVAGWRGGRDHRRRAAAVIARLGLPLDVATPAGGLSVQLRQRLEIVQALASEARVLLLDEPTAVLAPREVNELLDLVRRFRDQGGAVVLISHKLAEVSQIADRLTVLRRGSVTLTGAARDHDTAALSRAMIGSDPAPGLQAGRRGLRGAARPDTEREIRVELQEPGIVLHAGEIVGIAAIEGNGQRELLRAIGGVVGSVAAVEVTGSVAFVPEDRTREALVPEFSLTANLLLGNLDRASRWVDWSRWRRDTTAVLSRYDVRADGADAAGSTLSGGNQQKFILARALERRPDVLVVEHPTRGLDAVASAAIHAALRAAAADGACVVVHDSDLDEVMALASRLLVVTDGTVRELPTDTPRAIIGDVMLGLA
jgi:simple sugar transport system ATP-binding protein